MLLALSKAQFFGKFPLVRIGELFAILLAFFPVFDTDYLSAGSIIIPDTILLLIVIVAFCSKGTVGSIEQCTRKMLVRLQID